MVKIRTSKFGLVHNEFNFFCVSGTLGLEVTNAPVTAKGLGSKLTERVFFFKREIIRFKRNFGLLLSALSA